MPIRTVIQSVTSARLLVNNVDEYVSIGNGIVIYLSFTKGSSAEDVPKAVRSILSAELVHADGGKHQSVLETRVSVMVVPQASLAGKLKGTKVQYHDLIGKDIGKDMYVNFVNEVNAVLQPEAVACLVVPSEAVPAGEIGEGMSSRKEGGKDEKEAAVEDDADASSSLGRPVLPSRTVPLGEEGSATACTLAFGTYGNRQGLSVESYGPYTHCFEF